MVLNKQEQLLGATLLSAWNPWDMSFVRPTHIYGLNQKSDQKMGLSSTLSYCAILMMFYASITMQMLCQNGYISPSYAATRSTFIFQAPKVLIEEICGTAAEANYYSLAMLDNRKTIQLEIITVEAGVGH